MNGVTSSCGCYRNEVLQTCNNTHCMTSTPEYRVWCQMKNRCTCKTSDCYETYGGRGIKVCERWMLSFSSFIEDIGKRPSKGHSIERIDNNGNYCPENCRWAESKDQGKNRRTSVWIELDGTKKIACDWAKETGIPAGTILSRLRSGWSVRDSLTISPGRRKPRTCKTAAQNRFYSGE